MQTPSRPPTERRPAVPRRAMAVVAVLLGLAGGVAGGVGGYTFIYARGFSYMTNDPRACANCHVMHEQYDAWSRSSHHAVAACNDCHTPHNLIGKYATKASNGWHHSFAFTTGEFHEPIQITERNRRITEEACRHCHEPVVRMIDAGGHAAGEPGGGARAKEPMSCIRCHESVGHLH